MKKILLYTSFLLVYELSYSSIKIQITPPIYESEVNVGESRSFNILLKNNSSKRIMLKGYVQSFNIDQNGKSIFFDDPYQSHSCQNWISLNPKRIRVEPFEERQVTVLINVPEDATGGNYAAVFFDVAKNDYLKQEQSKVNLTVRTGTMVILAVKKTIKLDAEITSFEITDKIEKTSFKAILKNNSNIHIRPVAGIVIFENKKRVIDRINFNENNFIMPQSERYFQFIWDKKKKRIKGKTFEAECRFNVKGLGKSLLVRKKFAISP